MDFWSIFITRMTQEFYSPMKCFSDSVSLWYLFECVGKHTLLSHLLGNQERTLHLSQWSHLGVEFSLWVISSSFTQLLHYLSPFVPFLFFLTNYISYFSHCCGQIPDQKLLERKDLFGLTVCRDAVYPSGRGTAARVLALAPPERSGSRERWVGEDSRL